MDKSSPHRVTVRRAALTLLLAAWVIALSRPAFAACHNAAFTNDSVSVNESAGKVTLTVELVGGQPTCSGTVQYQTVNGTAKAGSDYTASQGTLSFSAGDDRRESFSVPIINDTSDEAVERFTVRLSGGTGDISADDTATVTIADNDPAPQQTTVSSPATASPSLSPTPSETLTGHAAPGDDTGGANAGVIAGIAVAIAALAGGVVWLLRKRAAH